ncbi:MAG: methylenetetrahydrofolate reductase [NAD(P)H] [Myxococcales bacterium]|jgi:methylenetetrahydrofolate reductase (NADPH)|nr:methylenetetrahydrofolate reductase [NAD(P)H] [Myxococcales bacterium]
MHINDVFETARQTGRTPFSFEFFPPKTERGFEKLYQTITQLMVLNPAYVSVTYGAGGSTRDNTHKLVTRLHQRGLTVVAHLTCEGSSEAEIAEILANYNAEGIRNILALKGDVPKDQHAPRPAFQFAADLVAFIHARYPAFGIGVAGFPEGHPDARNRLTEMDHLKAKVDSGANYIVTQLFFDNHDFLDFRERCVLSGIDVPIIPGIMPITTKSGMVRMADLAARCRFPAALLRDIANAPNDDEVARIGIAWATQQIRELLDAQVAGVHLYTLNNSSASLEIYRNLGMG